MRAKRSLTKKEERRRTRRRNLSHLFLSLLSCRGKVVSCRARSRQTRRVTAVLGCSQLQPHQRWPCNWGRWRGPPPSVTAAASVDGVSTVRLPAPAASRLLEEEGTTCSVVQPHLLRPHRHRSMSTAYVVRLATQDNWVWHPRTSCLLRARGSEPRGHSSSCDKFQSHLHLETLPPNY